MKHLEKYIDHTLLKPTAGMEDVRQLCREAKEQDIDKFVVLWDLKQCHDL